jgi:DNA topoisomerase-2
VGGRNGYGAKLTNIFSTSFTVDTARDGKRYTQTFRNNMSDVGKPVINESYHGPDFTKVC